MTRSERRVPRLIRAAGALRRWREIALAAPIAFAAACAGCSGGGGGGGATALPAAPSGLSYASPGPLVAGIPMSPLEPTLAAGSADRFQVAPSLPAGLAIDGATGTIGGTPLVASPLATYTITAENPAGSATFALDLEVVDPPLPIASFSVADSTAAESAGTAVIEIALSAAGAVDATIALVVSGSATAGSDFAALPPEVVVPAGQVTATIDVALVDDPTDEPAETIVVALDAPVGVLLGAPATHTLHLADDDRLPEVRFGSAALSFAEAPGTFAIDVLLDRDSAATIDIDLAIGGTADPGSDFTLSPASLALAPGATSATLTLEILDDGIFEGDETVVVELLPVAGAVAGTPAVVVITIGEGDAPPTVEIAAAASATEGAAPVPLAVTLSAISGADTLVSYLLGGSATPGIDYLIPTGPLAIPAGTLSAEIALEALADAAVEGPETAEVTLVAATGGVLGPSVVGTWTIEDATPALPVVTLAASGTVFEGAGPATFVATLSAVSSSRVVIPFTLGGSATAGVDYPTPASPIAIPAGSLGATIAISPIDDGLGEGPESVTVTLLPPSGATLGTPASQTVTIEEGAPPPEANLVGGGSVLESGSPLDLTLTLSAPATQPVEVTFALAGTATPGTDYVATPNPVTIAPGGTSAPITIQPVADLQTEGPETIIVTLAAAVGAVIGGSSSVTVTIDEAILPQVDLSGGGITAVEGNGPVFLTVALSAPSWVSVQVHFTYTGDATPVADYLAVPSPQTILPGSLTATIAIDPLADGLVEPDETVIVTLTGATGATLGAAVTRTITIEDDPTATAPPAGLAYSVPAATYTVGAAIAPNLATLASGNATSWSVLPPLPAGLEQDPQSGAITGAPDQLQSAVPYVVTAQNSLGSASATVTIEVRAAFSLAMSDPVVPYSPADGLASFSLSLTIEEDLGVSPVAPHGVQSIRGGIGFSPQQLSLVDVVPGSALALLNGGNGPDIFLPFPAQGGLTFGIVTSFSPAGALVAPSTAEWASLTFETVPGFLTGDPDGAVLAIPWLSTLGAPPVPCEVSYAGLFAHPPLLIPGTITFQP